MALKRILGAPTAWCVSMGVAIGSGIFRTPGEIAAALQSPGLIVLAWVVGGTLILIQGLVTAEVATRFPKAGGEYVFLREAYGRFVAFFFGWAYTVFVIGAGSAVIAIAFGDFTCDFFRLSAGYSGVIGAAAVTLVIVVNVFGLRAGADAQNVLTILKVTALVAIIVLGFAFGGRTQPDAVGHLAFTTPSAAGPLAAAGVPGIGVTLSAFLAAMLPVLWSYDGTNDSVKLAEEIKDVRRAMPIALIGSSLSLTVLYAGVNLALLQVIPAAEMAGMPSVPGEAFGRIFGATGKTAMTLAAMVVCLGSLSSTIPATVRVTFALARDGLTLRALAWMSKRQSPIPALIAVGTITILFTLIRDFTQVLGMYFLAATVLFGLSYASLIVFRSRESAVPDHVFRCPAGPVLAVIAIGVQAAVAVHVAITAPMSALYTVGLLAALGALYLIWPKERVAGGGGDA